MAGGGELVPSQFHSPAGGPFQVAAVACVRWPLLRKESGHSPPAGCDPLGDPGAGALPSASQMFCLWDFQFCYFCV